MASIQGGPVVTSDDDDLDDVSVTSTQRSDLNGDKEFDLEKILAERESSKDVQDEYGNVVQKKTREYLVQWVGYDIHESCWIEEANLGEGSAKTMTDWQTERFRRQRGLSKPFDIDKWQQDCMQVEVDRYHRLKKRRQKRQKLGLPLGRDPDEEYEFLESQQGIHDESFSDDDIPLVALSNKKQPRPRPEDALESSDDDKPLVSQRFRTIRNRSDGGGGSGSGSEGSLYYDVKSSAPKRRKTIGMHKALPRYRTNLNIPFQEAQRPPQMDIPTPVAPMAPMVPMTSVSASNSPNVNIRPPSESNQNIQPPSETNQPETKETIQNGNSTTRPKGKAVGNVFHAPKKNRDRAQVSTGPARIGPASRIYSSSSGVTGLFRGMLIFLFIFIFITVITLNLERYLIFVIR